MQKILENKKNQTIIFLAIYIVLFLIMLYAYPLREGHDIQSHYGRMNALYEAIRDGVYPIYFDQTMALGYGFATRFFYSDFVLLPFSLLIPYLGVIKSYQIMIIFYTLLCSILSYISCYKVLKNNYISFIFTILYTFSYYRLYDVYNRAAVGESICLTFLPLVFWGLYEIIKGDYKKWYIISFGFSFMILAHVNTPAIIAFIVAIICIINYKKFFNQPKRIAYLALAALVSILLTAYFIFPLLEQLSSNEFYFNTENGNRYTSNVLAGENIQHIIRGLFVGTTYMYPEIGGLGISITIVLLFRLLLKRKSSKLTKIGDFYLIIGIICFFIISPLYPWNTFPFNIIGFVQFSFRFYTPATFVLCIAAAIYLHEVFKNDELRYKRGLSFISLIIALLIINSGRIFSNEFKATKVIEPVYENHYHLMGADYMPSIMPSAYDFIKNRSNDSIRITYGENKIQNFKRENRILSFELTKKNETKLEVPLTYYKGYEAKLNAKKIDLEQSKYGLVEVKTNDNGLVEIFYEGTFIQKISPYISLISFFALILYIFRKSKKNSCI